MSYNLDEWGYQISELKLPRWDELINFDIYSDQVIQLVNNYLTIISNEDENAITGAMINNYVKLKLMPKPVKKKYTKVHLAYLIAISTLKQVLTIEQINNGIRYQSDISGLKGAYNIFCDEIERALKTVYLQIQNKGEEIAYDVPRERQAMHFAATAFANKIVADKILKIRYLQRKEENKDE